MKGRELSSPLRPRPRRTRRVNMREGATNKLGIGERASGAVISRRNR